VILFDKKRKIASLAGVLFLTFTGTHSQQIRFIDRKLFNIRMIDGFFWAF